MSFLGSFINEGQISTFVIELLFCIGLLVMISRARAGKKVPEIRKVPGLDALDEAVGRATEMGRPVHFSPGIDDQTIAMTLAGVSVLGYLARLTAKYDTRLIATCRATILLPVLEETIKASYTDLNKSDSYNPNDLRFLSEEQFAYASGVSGLMQREQVAANIMVGSFYAESLIFAEVGNMTGAIQIAGTAQQAQIPFFVAACDYCLIGEEIYAAGAYLSHDPILIGNLIGQDYGKWLATALVFVGCLLATFGNTAIVNWLNK